MLLINNVVKVEFVVNGVVVVMDIIEFFVYSWMLSVIGNYIVVVKVIDVVGMSVIFFVVVISVVE